MTSGMRALGYAPMIGVRRAADMSLAESARWTSAKFVVQYPNDSTKPSPNTMPTTDQNGLSIPVSGVPGQASSSAPLPAAMIFSWRPVQPPTRASPPTVSGTSSARITKNCSTSL